MKHDCTLCGNNEYDITLFKGGFVCEDCLEYIRNVNTQKED